MGLRLPWVPLLPGLSGPLGPRVLGSMHSRRHVFPQVVLCRPNHTATGAQIGIPSDVQNKKLQIGMPKLKGVGSVQGQVKKAQATQETVGARAVLATH